MYLIFNGFLIPDESQSFYFVKVPPVICEFDFARALTHELTGVFAMIMDIESRPVIMVKMSVRTVGS